MSISYLGISCVCAHCYCVRSIAGVLIFCKMEYRYYNMLQCKICYYLYMLLFKYIRVQQSVIECR